MQCPRCLAGEEFLQRDSLFNSSPFLKAEERGKKLKTTKIRVWCSRCGYDWRSISKSVPNLPEKQGE